MPFIDKLQKHPVKSRQKYLNLQEIVHVKSMRKQLLTLLLITVCFSGYSQAAKQLETTETPKEIYSKLKILFIKQLDSKSYKIADSLSQVFYYKMTPDMTITEISKENEDYLEWTKANLSKTEFKEVAEAEKLWAEYEAANLASVRDNKEYFDYLLQIIKIDGGVEINTNVVTDVYMDNPKRNRIKLPKRRKKSDFYPKLPTLPDN